MTGDSSNLNNRAETDELERLRRRNAQLEEQLAQLQAGDAHSTSTAAVEDLRHRLHQLERALAYAPDLLYIFDTSGRFTYTNRPLRSLAGRPREDAFGKDAFDLGYPEGLAKRLQAQLQQVMESRATLQTDTPYTAADGYPGYYEYILTPVPGDQGEIEAVVGCTRDVTEQRKIEEALRESEQRFSTAFADAPVGMVLAEPTGKFVDVNPAFLAMIGYTREEVASQSSDRFTHPDDVEATHRFTQALHRGEAKISRLEKRYFHKDGRLIWVRLSGSMRRDREGKPVQVIAIIEDITQRKQVEQALQASEERLRQLFAQAPVAVCLLRGHALVCELVNPYFENLFPGRDLLGRQLREAIQRGTPAIAATLQRVLQTGVPESAIEFHLSTDLKSDGHRSDHWFNFSFQPLQEIDGSISSVVVVAVDVTPQVRARQNLEFANRELEEFAYVASHDLQEPLRMVNAYTQLLMRDLQPYLEGGAHDGIRDFAHQITSGVQRMEQLLKDLLKLSQVVHATSEGMPVSEADLGVCLRAALNTLHKHIEDQRACVEAGPMPRVRGDETQLTQVFQNLISNALKYVKPENPCRFRITARQQSGQWIISFQDNGIGFEQEQAERVFGLFKRLHKDQYPGTGLGLAICKRIVERYGGLIWAESSPGTELLSAFRCRRLEKAGKNSLAQLVVR